MNNIFKSRVYLIFLSLILLGSYKAQPQQIADWTWEDRYGQKHTRTELENLLNEHSLWITSNTSSGHRLNISGADLNAANLNGEDLSGGDLTDTSLRSATLIGAELYGTNLSGAILFGANLSGAKLYGVNLSYAHSLGANLTDADLGDANLIGVSFEPRFLPDIRAIAKAQHLELMTYDENPDALVQLRKSFADGGFQEQERKITYAIKRKEAELLKKGCLTSKDDSGEVRAVIWSYDSNLANCGSLVLNRVFFDLTCQYGMSPSRSLTLGILLWGLCAILYLVCIHTTGNTGLYRVYGQGLEEDPSAHRHIERILVTKTTVSGLRHLLDFVRCEWRGFRVSMFFSLMSAFNIGFRDINFGRWLRLLTRREFDLKAAGWARVIAGWQSLISVFLIAMWVLTYFGRLFA